MGKVTYVGPVPLSSEHDVAGFCCGVASLDSWLKNRARANQVSGGSKTYVITKGKEVVGYYSLASGGLTVSDAPGPIRRNMPDPIPMTLLGRLAVDQSFQAKGAGTILLQDAVLRTGQAAHIIGIRGLLVHALSEEAKAFYEHHGFVSSPTQPMTLILSLKGVS